MVSALGCCDPEFHQHPAFTRYFQIGLLYKLAKSNKLKYQVHANTTVYDFIVKEIKARLKILLFCYL